MPSQWINYFKSGFYDQRYPQANLASLKIIISTLSGSDNILDFGSGSGRYSIPLAPYCNSITAYDPCPEAIKLLEHRKKDNTNILITSSFEKVERHKPYDIVISMFGVISHIEPKINRLNTLKSIRNVMSSNGTLIIGVPNRLRRFYVEQFKALMKGDNTGQIHYKRSQLNETFPYFLYTVNSLKKELEDNGFSIKMLLPESILPETVVTRIPFISNLEQKILHLTPANLGYGILVIATPK
jgi:2-polyprenyl-3-methyl-5-hydroxy-6-metoxy-1,4-benzoquinol methylase